MGSGGRRWRPWLAAAVAALSVMPAAAGERTDGIAALAGRISADALERHVEVLASDACEGRGPGSAGSARAVRYLEAQLAAIGLEPLGEGGGWRQPVPLVISTPQLGTTLELSSLGATRALRLGRDYLLLTSGDQTIVPRPVPVVFVGWGIVAPEFDHDDYAGLDVRGRVVAFLDGEPPSSDPAWFGGDEPTVYASPETKQRIALSRGAVATILLPVGQQAVASWSRRVRAYGFPAVLPAADLPRTLSIELAPDQVPALFADGLYSFDRILAMRAAGTAPAFHLPVSLRFVGEFAVATVLEPNLIARLPGSDRGLADTAVVLSAHWDHLGRGPAVAGDAIYNGAVDNALGVAGVLEIARVLAAQPTRPRRSVVVLLTTAEEAGLLGARTFLEHPPIPLSRMVADVNVDGLAFISDFCDLIAVGGDLSDLGDRLRRAVAPLGLSVHQPPQGVWSAESFAYSDQLAFAERGVPSIMVNEGFDWPGVAPQVALRRELAWMLEVYHSPRDESTQAIDWAAARRHAGAVLALVANLADDRQTPAWRPGVPYAYQRLLSLAEERGR